MPGEEISYSDRYVDPNFEYRHVTLPSSLSKLVPKNHLVRIFQNFGNYHFNDFPSLDFQMKVLNGKKQILDKNKMSKYYLKS